MEEVKHIIEVIDNTIKAIKEENFFELKELSNQTIHCALCFQDAGTTTLPVLIYAISKILERRNYIKIKNWDKFISRFISSLSLANTALKQGDNERFDYFIQQARSSLTSMSINLKPYVEEVLQKARINKAGKIYEHGISLGKTAQMLGISQWELSEYTGQGKASENSYNSTITTKKRAAMALEFFS